VKNGHNASCPCVDDTEQTVHRGVCPCGWVGSSFRGRAGVEEATDEIYAHLHDMHDRAGSLSQEETP
jgi:hypothetical protein